MRARARHPAPGLPKAVDPLTDRKGAPIVQQVSGAPCPAPDPMLEVLR